MHENWGGLLQSPLPGWLGSLLNRIDSDLGIFEGPANHVLLNAYEPGEGILVWFTQLKLSSVTARSYHVNTQNFRGT